MKKQLRQGLLAAIALCGTSLAHAYDVWAVNTSNELIRFDNTTPGTPGFSAGISGLVQSDGVTSDPFGQITNISFAGSTLYGIDANANLYTLSLNSGAASLVSNTFAPAGFDLGLAYDPFISGGGLRVVTDAGENFSTTLGGVFTAGNNVFVGSGFSDANEGASLSFSGLAIDPDFGIGYAFDHILDTLFITYDANFEEFFTIGGLGGDYTALASIQWVDENTLLAALSEDSFTSDLYTIDLGTGAATLVGSFETGVTSIAVNGTAAIPEAANFGLVAGLAGLSLVTLRRRRRVATV